jgi:formiminotetrahydrofolate cyclodeaminase
MAYRDETLDRYLADAAAGQPTPGGGSASALAAAAGAAMACMAANFTVGRKKFADREPRVLELLDRLETAREALLGYVDDDVAAYAQVSAAYGMPKKTDDEKAARRAAIQDALKLAMATPLRVFDVCADAIGVLDELADLANPNLISDVGVAAALLAGALDGAELNVAINLATLKDADLVTPTQARLDERGPVARGQAAAALDKVRHAIAE